MKKTMKKPMAKKMMKEKPMMMESVVVKKGAAKMKPKTKKM